ncbi:MAG: rod shape-determining protein RodA [Methylacidiphilales bacterium]|nr:rod shape-determining protein RodA [Candidatus Methylacidiphilales bacterium]MDW8349272.1 FtsW/RodA/SpoVE family cell cycle protein [Verrucomicrobiae bacterium]
MNIKLYFRKLWAMDWALFFIVLGLCTASYYFVHSATYMHESAEMRTIADSQRLWIIIGFIFYIIAALIDYKIWIKHAHIIFLFSLVLLVAVLLFGTVVNNSKSWIRIGNLPGIQPAEFSKLAFICFAVAVMIRASRKGGILFILMFILAAIPMALILKQPDLGSAFVFLPIVYAIMLVGGVKKRYLAIPIILLISAIIYLYYYVYKLNHKIPFLKTYQMERILTFFDPNRDPRNAGWTINQSLIAIGSGGMEGRGYLQGGQNKLGFLPRDISYTDFIFSVVAEEFGFRGASLLIIALTSVMLLSIKIALKARDLSGMLLVTGIVAMLFTHTFINIGMTMKVVPITGIPLPFTSYGGTFMVTCLTAVGLVQSVWIHRRYTFST